MITYEPRATLNCLILIKINRNAPENFNDRISDFSQIYSVVFQTYLRT